MIKWRGQIALVLVGMLGACASVEVADQDRPGGGIGGTGIVGTVTDFGSIIVNGVTVALPDTVVVTTPFGSGTTDGIRIGHTVEIVARTTGETTEAELIHHLFPLIGHVDQSAPGVIKVLGTDVVLPEDAASPEVGSRVMVSGLWRGKSIVASRVEPAPEGARDRIAGVAEDSEGLVKIGAVRLLNTNDNVEPGAYVRISGEWTGAALIVEGVRTGRAAIADSVDRLIVEGYAAPDGTIDGLGLPVPVAEPQSGPAIYEVDLTE